MRGTETCAELMLKLSLPRDGTGRDAVTCGESVVKEQEVGSVLL